MEGYLLDSAGFAALDFVAGRFKVIAEEIAAARGAGVGPALSPGTLEGWSASDQFALCSLVDLDAIGVQLQPPGRLVPRNSMSLLIGLGEGYGDHQVGPSCVHCSLKETCPQRER